MRRRCVSSSEELGSTHPVNRLIHELAESRRAATDEEIQSIRVHVAGMGFDPLGTMRVGSRMEGTRWDGRTIGGSDRFSTGIAHYLLHVIHDREWPNGTSYDRYVESLRDVVIDSAGGIVASYEFDVLRLSFVSRARYQRGPGGNEWILVGYNVDYGWWTTGFQPDLNLDHFALAFTKGAQWLQRPTY